MKYEFVDYEQKGQVAVISMNRPERKNSMSREMMRDLGAAFETFEDDDSVRAAILTGVGNVFCSGLDTRETVARGNVTAGERRQAAKEMSVYQRLRDGKISKVVITAVNGYALGGGWFLAMGGDLVVAAESVTFQQMEPLRGLMDYGRTFAEYNLPWHIGLELSLGFKITAQRAFDMGLINRVVPDDQLIPTALEIGNQLCELAPLSLKYIVEDARRFKFTNMNPLAAALGQVQTTEILAKSEDFREAFKAAVEKRKPAFKGR